MSAPDEARAPQAPQSPQSPPGQPGRRPGGGRLLYLLPLGVFAALAVVFLVQLGSGDNPQDIPSALIGRPAPDVDLPPLEGVDLPGLVRADMAGRVTLVNVFASWCGPCRIEHPIIEALGEDERLFLVGINYKDAPGDAREWLEDVGNPYDAIGTDRRGRQAIEWGVYGVPETFVVDRTGTITFKFIGPLSPETLEERLMPEIEKALAG